MDQELLSNLRQVLNERLNESELRDLCFDLGVDYESLSGEGKADKARELVSFLQRRKRIPELIMKGEKQRPDIVWSQLLFDVKPGAEWIGLGKAMEATGYSPDYLTQLAEKQWVRARKDQGRETDEGEECWLFDRDVIWFHSRGWINNDEAHVVTGYTVNYLRSLAREEMVVGRKIRGMWLMRRDSLLDYCRARGRKVVDTLPPIEEAQPANDKAKDAERALSPGELEPNSPA
jgi:hypothetical protein